MKEKLNEIREKGLARIAATQSIKELVDVRRELTGKKSELNEVLRSLGKIDPEQRKEIGILSTQVKDLFAEKLNEKEEEVVREEVAQELYDLYHALDSKKDSILDNMIKLGITINYRYYAGSDDAPYKTISLPASYIKRVGSKRR